MVGHKLENFHQLDLLEVTLVQKIKVKKNNKKSWEFRKREAAEQRKEANKQIVLLS